MRKFLLRYCICLLLSPLLCSCSQGERVFLSWDDSFGDIKKISSIPLLSEELILGQPFIIQYVDSSLVIFDNIGDSLFIVIDLAHNNKVFRYGQKGEGNNEFLQVFSFSKMADNTSLGVYDAYRRVLRKMDIKQLKRGVESYPIIGRDTIGSIKLFKTCSGANLGVGFYENNMLSLSSDSGFVHYFYEYPYRNKREKSIPNRLRGMAYQGNISSNSTLDKFLYTVYNAPIFIVFEVKGDSIKKTYEFIGDYPIYKTEETDSWIAAPISADNKCAFLASYATDNFIYLLYSGKTFRESDLKASQGNIIYQLSWEGKPINKFELDFEATNFCVSDDDKVLYALVNKGEIEIVQYNLKDNYE